MRVLAVGDCGIDRYVDARVDLIALMWLGRGDGDYYAYGRRLHERVQILRGRFGEASWA